MKALMWLLALLLLVACGSASGDNSSGLPPDLRATASVLDAQASQAERAQTAVAVRTENAVRAQATGQALSASATQAAADAQATQAARALAQAQAQAAATQAAQARAATAQAQATQGEESRQQAQGTATAGALALAQAQSNATQAAQATAIAATPTALEVQRQQTLTAIQLADQVAAAERAREQANLDAGIAFWSGWIVKGALALLGLVGMGLMLYALYGHTRVRVADRRASVASALVVRDRFGDPVALLTPIEDGFALQPFCLPTRVLPPGPPVTVIDPPSSDLPARPLDLTTPHAPNEFPLGVTAEGDLWVPLEEHVLVGGSTGTGKTFFLHGVIQALIAADRYDLWLYDGKREKHFSRYGQAHVSSVENGALAGATGQLIAEMEHRDALFRERGVVDLAQYNRMAESRQQFRPWVLVVDELASALEEDGVMADLMTLARLGREAGIRLIVSTQQPEGRTVPNQLRDNCLLRIAFRVPRAEVSRIILGFSGAERLTEAGRFLALVGPRQVLGRSFRVELPDTPRLAAGSRLPFTPQEIEILEYAAVERGGKFEVRALAERFRLDDTALTKLGDRLEARGWATGTRREKGQIQSRQLTPDLLDLLSYRRPKVLTLRRGVGE